ncbi:unnamed protein product [Nyctereutes procyonoides]|uniref:(raccoon dog) hypothetical protein n=1 Tax=Nyctereutes procyonoides TaxID=34880 RepID=A0A811ZQ99_NYCPR|nr:unnamed protein product [Nyctereutes procyonoides]
MSPGAHMRSVHGLVEQLKLEASIEKIKVFENACKVALLVGVPAGSNPFWKPKSRTLF